MRSWPKADAFLGFLWSSLVVLVWMQDGGSLLQVKRDEIKSGATEDFSE